ncbi:MULTISPECIES: hypothetical protein [Methanobacterium]|uniref:Uncharacterized protein n=1 Tax=Methanobacterium veterum TaxID=408577 RepID=A0A9E4ZZU1_9EURY|nr:MULTISPECIES: hypothetical protein [Methanobacterium]MCZ3365405.1 hypothetical protein [Methanobacterium veterum]MCZ3373156.1 hypothetical protein [Methanobacterium veterum]
MCLILVRLSGEYITNLLIIVQCQKEAPWPPWPYVVGPCAVVAIG